MKHRLRELILYYVIINGILAVFIGLAHWSLDTYNPSNTILHWLQFALLQLLAADLPLDANIDLNVAQSVLYTITSILGAILPAIFLGTVVFKLFVRRKVIIFARKCSVSYSETRGRYELYIRFYSSTPLELRNVTVRAFLSRLYFVSEFNSTYRATSELRQFERAMLTLHHSHVFRIALDNKDISYGNQGMKLESIEGKDIGNAKLIVHVFGLVPNLGTEFFEEEMYEIPDDVMYGKYVPIGNYDVPARTKSKDWPGWDMWEKVLPNDFEPEDPFTDTTGSSTL